MCFSAGASFIAGTVLTGIGITSVRKVKKNRHYFFAAIHIIFGIQQVAEGYIWLGLNEASNSRSAHLASYVFLFIAQVIWPFWVPMSILFLDKKKIRNNIQKLLLLLGCILSLYMAYCLYWFEIDAKINGHHIVYTQAYPKEIRYYVMVSYGLVTILPALVSQVKSMWMLGLFLLLSYLITAIYYEAYTLSVWCFFAALISSYVYYFVIQLKTQAESKVKRLVMDV
jgi:hypothetical protein